MGSYWISCFSG
ncbi:hypothetical protein Tco_1207079, partial [Tanacetum coccineum]